MVRKKRSNLKPPPDVATQSFIPEQEADYIAMDLRGIQMGDPPILEPRFKQSVAERGIINPPVLNFVKGRYWIVDGRRRLHALREAQEAGLREPTETFMCMVYQNLTPGECARLTIDENNQRNANEVADLEAIRVLEEQGLDAKQIARKLHLTTGTIKRRKALGHLKSETLMSAVEGGRLKFTTGLRISKLPEDAQLRLEECFLRDGNLSAKLIREATEQPQAEQLGFGQGKNRPRRAYKLIEDLRELALEMPDCVSKDQILDLLERLRGCNWDPFIDGPIKGHKREDCDDDN